VLLAFGLRLRYALQPEPFVDEPTTLLVAQAIARTGVPRLPSGFFYGNDLPYSYLMGGLVALVGPSLLAARLLSVAASVLTAGLVYLVGRRVLTPLAGLWGAALLALNPEAILWGGRARAYGLLGLLAFLAAAAFFWGVASDRPLRRRLGLALLVLSAFVHPEAALLLPAFVLGSLAVRDWRWWLRAGPLCEVALAALGLAARYGLQLALARGLVGGYQTLAGSRPPLQWAVDLPLRVQSVLPFFAEAGRWPLTLLALAALAGAAWRLGHRRPDGRDRAVLFFSACFWLVPLQMVLFLGSTYQGSRYLNLLLPILALLAARGLEEILLAAVTLVSWLRRVAGTAETGSRLAPAGGSGSWPAVLASTVLALLLLALLPGALAASATQERGYRSAFEIVARGWQPGDRVATVAPAAGQLLLGRSDYLALGLEYEEFVYRDGSGQLVDRWLGSPLLRSADDLETALAAEGRLWFVVDEMRFRRRFEPAFVRMVWDRMELVGYTAGVLVLRSFPAVEPAVSRPSGALFGEGLLLERYDLGSPANRPAAEGQGDLVAVPGEDLRLTLHWQATRPLAGTLHVFLHVVGEDGQRFAPADGPPLDGVEGALPLDRWLVGETLPDRRSLPLPDGLAPGLYRLEVGLYEPSTGDRLPVAAAEGRVLDGALLLDYFRVAEATGADVPLPQAALSVDFSGQGDRVRLSGYDLGPGPARAGGSLDLVLYWQRQERLQADYTVFVHLLDDGGRIWGQGDGRPAEGFYPTGLWDPGEIVVDRHQVAIDPGASSGTYQLAVGLYHLPTGRRLGTAVGDAFTLAEIEVGP
jgi:4-amino-4-deoxy-L-arabinose transferase-like glycosyltransferase